MALIATTCGFFVGLLAMIGVYGVRSHAAAERTREIACVRGVQKTPEAARMAFAMVRENGDWLCAARPPAGSGGGLKWQTWQTFGIPKSRLSSLKSGGREGIRTSGLLVANEVNFKLRRDATGSTPRRAFAVIVYDSAQPPTTRMEAGPQLVSCR